jgi:hypothetical protein
MNVFRMAPFLHRSNCSAIFCIPMCPMNVHFQICAHLVTFVVECHIVEIDVFAHLSIYVLQPSPSKYVKYDLGILDTAETK